MQSMQEANRTLLTKYDLIDIVPSNLSLGKLESELISERDSHYYLADKIDEINGDYLKIIVPQIVCCVIYDLG
jgi:cellulose biosynthesis protein BcsQ